MPGVRRRDASVARTLARRLLAAAALACAAAAAQGADAVVACPDLAAVVQVATCPSEAELKYTFTGFCADNARLYDKDPACESEQAYRRKKNVALWESRDGEFQGYLSCEAGAAAPKDGKALRIAVSRAGTLTRVACTYADGVVFTRRLRASCTVAGDGGCATGECKASCQ